MPKILIIKLGALGDVLRTTPLLRRLRGPVTWITGRRALPLLAGNRRIARLLSVEDSRGLRGEKFDWVINFDEDRRACALAAAAAAPRKTGAVLAAGAVTYCAASAPWFDMSLISRLGRREADRLKYKSRKTYQEHLFCACGLEFKGEEYMLPGRFPGALAGTVAIETRAGARWPLKGWTGYRELAALLEKAGVEVRFLRQRRRLLDYLADIGRCQVLVSGDTFAMHAALALGRRAAALFNCTSPWEIHGYGRLTRLVNPGLRRLYYSTAPLTEKTPAVSPRAVYRAVMRLLRE
ncbi:MAG: hypothetical protein NDI60_04060 [Elusimicrobiales bacterium]|nr:hypothetical protein [Elusimicrobiales bacterium]